MMAHLEQGFLDQVLQVSDHSHETSVQQGIYEALPQDKALGGALVGAVWRVQGSVDQRDHMLTKV